MYVWVFVNSEFTSVYICVCVCLLRKCVCFYCQIQVCAYVCCVCVCGWNSKKKQKTKKWTENKRTKKEKVSNKQKCVCTYSFTPSLTLLDFVNSYASNTHNFTIPGPEEPSCKCWCCLGSFRAQRWNHNFTSSDSEEWLVKLVLICTAYTMYHAQAHLLSPSPFALSCLRYLSLPLDISWYFFPPQCARTMSGFYVLSPPFGFQCA